MKSEAQPILIAHRGVPVIAPENTLPSFLAAVEAGASWIELDVRPSRDGALMVIHDASVRRTTDGYGAVHELSQGRLRELDAGSWFHPDYAGSRIPTLEEVLSAIPNTVCIDIELKTPPRSAPLMGGMVRDLVSLLEARNRLSTVVLTSFSIEAMRHLRGQHSGLRLGFLDHGRVALPRRLEMLKELGVEWYIRNILTLTRGISGDVKERGMDLASFTINSPRAWRKAREMGVRYLITDDIRTRNRPFE